MLLGAILVAAGAGYIVNTLVSSFVAQRTPISPKGARARVLRASPVDSVENPVRTVANTLEAFWKAYPQPPVVPMYRPILIDILTQAHLAMADPRFAYDAVFALGLRASFVGLMGSYDRMVGSPQEDAIWEAFVKAAGLDPAKVKTDADAVAATAKASTPAQILEQLESGESDLGVAMRSIKEGLYNKFFSVGMFQVMDLCGAEATKANVEEWAKVLKISDTKALRDLATYSAQKSKIQQAEEMFREIEIREKKKLAERLEEKAKALAAKAAAKAAEA